jgi:predicted nuclease of predicted toxin-antitoxin system
VRQLGLSRAQDADIWSSAIQQNLVIVSKDEDFAERALLEGPPPKVVWIRLGNCTTEAIDELLRARREVLLAFESERESPLLVIP